MLGEVSVSRAYGALLVPRLVGDAGLRWLGEEPFAMPSAGRLLRRGCERAAADRRGGGGTGGPPDPGRFGGAGLIARLD